MFSVIMDDKSVEDISYRPFKANDTGRYNVKLGDRTIAQLFKLPSGWSCVVVGETEFIRCVHGFRTREDGVIYALRALRIGAYNEFHP